MSPESAQIVMLLNDPDVDELAALRRRAPRQSAIIAALHDHPKGVKVSFLQRKVGAEGLAAQLSALEEKGFISRATTQGAGVKEKRKKAIRIADWLLRDDEALRELFDQLDRQAPKQSAILSYLYGRGGNDESVLLTEVLEKTASSASAVSALHEKGAIVVEEIEVSRESILEELDSIGIVDRYEGEFVANADQQKAIDAIVSSYPEGFTPFLLHGVTGSGKTHVYIEALKATIALGRKGLMLVPEIALTVQLVERFKAVFGDRIVLLHSRMTEGERYDGWKRSAAGDCDLVIGPRSALFAPLRNVGLIVVDEEHESSYKQYDAQPRYNARDAAVVRARIEGAAVVMGSATPSIESFHNAGVGKYRLLELPQRVDGALEPKMVLVDTQSARKQNMMKGSLSTLLIKSIRERIAKSEGTILFQNRRGFSTRLECTNCAHSPNCPNCSVTLTFHKGIEQLRCHYCGYNRKRENECELCGSHDLRQPGIGTQRVEEELRLELPEARVLRMDLDTTSKKGAHKKMLAEFGRGEIDVLLGTQMVAKGLDFPRVSLVGVVSADTQLMLPDFRSGERTFQLITQVAGRAGRRSETPGEVIIQTGHPDHPAIVNAFAKDYRNMVDDEIRTRRELNYPPFARFILIEFRSKDQKDAETHARSFRDLLPRSHDAIEILGPTAALIWKLRNLYRYQIIVKNIKSKDPGGSVFTRLYTAATEQYNKTIGTSSVEMIVDVDAYGSI
jgi:primosomal protein N' (replication factor Y)